MKLEVTMARVRGQSANISSHSSQKGGIQFGEDPPDSSSEDGESVLAEDVLSENGFPPSPLPSVPKPGSERKLSRRRRLTNFLLRRGHHRSTRKHHHGHPRKKHRGWIKRRQPRANSSGSSSSSLGSEEDRIGSLEDERIGRPPMCGASYGDWSVPGADSYSVRQYDYKQTKEKGFSATPSFYELHAIDTYCSPSRMDRIFEHVEGLEETLGCPAPSGHPDIPRILIINCQLPNCSPSLYSSGDGPTINIVLYYKLDLEFRRYIALGLDHAEVPPAARLFAEWCASSEDDDSLRGRFKAIGRAVNTEELRLPSVVKRYNGRPILIYGRESSMSFDRERQIVELGINAHNFSYFGRRVLYGTYAKFREALVSIGFVIEARTNDELPEHILGTAIFRQMDLQSLEQLSWDNDTLVVGDEEDRILVTATKYESDDKSNTEELQEMNGGVLEPSPRMRMSYFADGKVDHPPYSSQDSQYLSLALLILALLLWTTLAYISKKDI